MVKGKSKSKRIKMATVEGRQSLPEQLLSEQLSLEKSSKAQRGAGAADEMEEDVGRARVDAHKLFKQARQQQLDDKRDRLALPDEPHPAHIAANFDSAASDSDSDAEPPLADARLRLHKTPRHPADHLDMPDLEFAELSEQDRLAFEMFARPRVPGLTLADELKSMMSNGAGDVDKRERTADDKGGEEGEQVEQVLREKLAEKDAELRSRVGSCCSASHQKPLDPRVVDMYKQIREVLQKYRSGRLPKPLKVVPVLQNWEQIVAILDPASWSAASMYQATKMFASNMDERRAQRFYSLVLLPRVRDDIAEYKRLNFHLYSALKKALFKPGAFFKGIVLPLCEGGDCTLREAIIVSSVLTHCSVPMLHSAAALLKIAEVSEYSPAASVFLRALLAKKYALPYKVVDALVVHFVNTAAAVAASARSLPLLWHQAFLTFVDIYRADIAAEQKDALLDVLHRQNHYEISPEIRHILVNSTSRDIQQDVLVDQQ